MKKFLKNFTIVRDINIYFFRRKWRKLNKHNFTKPNNKFKIEKVSVGRFTYGDLNVNCFGNAEEKLEIGDFCSIAPNVNFLLSGEHEYNFLFTFPVKKFFYNEIESKTKGKIIIEDDVWIGYGAMILSGVKIGKGAIIGAGSVVAKDVPPYAIYAGNKIIKYRFSKEIIEELIKIDFKKFTPNKDDNKLELLYSELNNNNYKDVIREVFNNEY